MRIAGLQVDASVAVATICGVCAFVLATTVGINIVEATGNPVTQFTPAENTSSTIPQVNVDSSSTQLEPESKRHSGTLSKEERKAETHRVRRLVVLDFLEKHFPELRESLLKSEQKSLKKSRNAIKRIEWDIIHLNGIKQKHPGKFELAVEQWKVKTQIDITIAKYAKKENDDQLRQRLEPLIEEMLMNRKSILEFDRQTVTKRLGKIDKQLSNLENNSERVVEHRLRLFQNSIDEIRTKHKMKKMKSETTSKSDRARSEEKP